MTSICKTPRFCGAARIRTRRTRRRCGRFRAALRGPAGAGGRPTSDRVMFDATRSPRAGGRRSAAGSRVVAIPVYAATAGLRGARTAGKSTSVPARLLK